MCSWKFRKNHSKTSLACEIFKNTFFTEHIRKTASAFSFSEAATGGVLWEKVFLKISENSQENTFGWRNFKKHLSTSASGFFVQRYSNGILPTVFRKPQMNIHHLEALTLEVLFRYIILFFSRINFQCMPSLVYCQKQPSE